MFDFSKKHIKPGQTLIFQGKEYAYSDLDEILNPVVSLGGPESREAKTTFAFECGGKRFFTCVAEEMTAHRYKEYLLRHEENRMGISFEVLKELQKKKRDILTQGREYVQWEDYRKIDLEIDFRLDHVLFEDTIYSFCSVMYFEKSEDLTTYSITENNDKIAFWKQHKAPSDFFLQKPVKELIGLKDISSEDLAAFLKRGRMALAVLSSYTK